MNQQKTDTDLLYGDPELVQFYDLENEWAADQDYCVMLARDIESVLDLGCGTGRLVAGLATQCDAVGVDPATAMLDVARKRSGGEKATWIEGDARTVRLARRFDLIVLTGHAFQVFLTAQDQRAVLDTIAVHLAPKGRFIFDTRNPAMEEWRKWTPDDSRRFIRHPQLGQIEAWNDASRNEETGIVTYQTHYQVADGGQHFSATSDIAFPSKETVADMIDAAGLKVRQWFGDWRGAEYTRQSSEIIPLGGLV